VICEKCKTAGDINEEMIQRGEMLERTEQAFRNRITQLHEQCTDHDCMCQHRVGVYVARGQEVSKAAE
jgi:hypothetical protein